MHLLLCADTPEMPAPVCRPDGVAFLGDLSLWFIQQVMARYPQTEAVGVLGNHDSHDLPPGITPLHGRTGTIGPFTCLGINGCIPYKDSQRYAYWEDEIDQLLQPLPYVDIVFSHNSPRGVHEHGSHDDIHRGWEALRAYIIRHQPRYVFHGHQHRSDETRIGSTRIVGVYGPLFFPLI